MFYSNDNIVNNDKTCNEIYKTLQEIRRDINRRIDLIENLEILSTILSYSIYEKQYESKNQIAEIEEKRKALEELDLTDSELNEKVDELNLEFKQIEQQQDEKLFDLNHRQAKTTQHMEELMAELDFYFEQLQVNYRNYSKRIAEPPSETCLLTDNFSIILDDYDNYIAKIEKLQINYWKLQSLDVKFASVFKENGLKITNSGSLLAQNDEKITYEEAHNRGYFNRLYQLFDDLSPAYIKQSESKELPSTKSTSIKSSLFTQMTSEEVSYLKTTVGRTLTLALAEITMKQPRDPIHYLGQWLFKYRFNQDFDKLQTKELEELLEKRREIAYKRWKEFVETEARAAVLEIVARVEQIIYEKELKLIEAMARIPIVLVAEDESGDNGQF